ncbi:hypothetical protein [Aminipila sp.]|uniref:hypothetical protein n=1 Tax=Aminipila sp. TaxID=2060095 RepID=UPI0028A04ECA|nr:hypothetical protein [Aminipila sp.]
MYIQTQDGKATMPCEAIRSEYDDNRKAYVIATFYPDSKQTYKVAHYRNEKQFKGVFRELQENLVSGERKIYYLPPDEESI